MEGELERRIAAWDGLAVVSRFDSASGAWIFVALHDDTLGRPVGGTRVKVYEAPGDGLEDATRLAAGMTYKWASIEEPFGGGKAVIALSRELAASEREGLLDRYAHVVNALCGAFATGQDLGTTPAEMAFLAERSPWIHGVDPETGAMRDPGPYTALGVMQGLYAAFQVAFGAPDVSGRTVLVQGLGDVGAPLARLVAAGGGRVLLSDLDAARVQELACELGAEVVSPEEVYDHACDAFAPCAVGAILSAETIPRLACRVVAGSANNQLREEADAERLFERGILYAPDYVVNAGGAAAFARIGEGETDETVIRGAIERLFEVNLAILREATEREESPLHAARRRVDRVLGR